MAIIPTDEDLKLLLKADCHRGSEKLHKNMASYVYKKASDSKSHIFDLYKTWQKIHAAALLLATVSNPKDICLVSSTPWGKRSIFKFSQYTQSYSISGRFTPGTFTNQICKSFREPSVLIVCDPSLDFQPIKEASYVNVPIIAFCDTDTSLEYIDLAIPCNNKSKYSVSAVFYLLCRELLKMRGEITPEKPWNEKVDLFIYKDNAELERLMAAEKQILEEQRRKEEAQNKKKEEEKKQAAMSFKEPVMQGFEESDQGEYERGHQGIYEGDYVGDYDGGYGGYRETGHHPVDMKTIEQTNERREAMSSKEAIDLREATEMKEEAERRNVMERSELLERRELRDPYSEGTHTPSYLASQETAYRMAAANYNYFPPLSTQDIILPRQSTMPSEKMLRERMQQERISQERMQRERMNYSQAQYYSNSPNMQRGFQEYYQSQSYTPSFEQQMGMRQSFDQQPPFRQQETYSRAGFPGFGPQGIRHGESSVLNYPTHNLSNYNPYASQGQSFGQGGQYRPSGIEQQQQPQPRQGNFYTQGEFLEQRRQPPMGGFRPGSNVPPRHQGGQ